MINNINIQENFNFNNPANIVPLTEMYYGIDKIDINEIDLFANRTFSELIEERIKANLSYFIAILKDERGFALIADAGQFLQFKLDHNKDFNPKTRANIVDYSIFKFNKIQKVFERFCGPLQKNDKATKEEESRRTYYHSQLVINEPDLKDEQYTISHFLLGKCYFFGMGTERDVKAAYKHLKIAATRGNYMGNALLALLYEKSNVEGMDKQSSRVKAFECRMRASQCPEVQPSMFHIIGESYELGNGVAKDLVKALKYYNEAANRGYSRSVQRIKVLINRC